MKEHTFEGLIFSVAGAALFTGRSVATKTFQITKYAASTNEGAKRGAMKLLEKARGAID